MRLTDHAWVFGIGCYEEKQNASLKLFTDIAFRVWVMKYAIGKNYWHVIGHVNLNSELKKEPVFYKYDLISKKYSHYINSIETSASREQCIGLENAAVWDPEHIESRLIDLKNGNENVWGESLKA